MCYLLRRMNSSLLFVILVMLFSHTAMYAQKGNFSVHGIIIDSENTEPVMGANVQLLQMPDSTYVKGVAAGNEGEFEFASLPKGKYTVKISFIGYQTHCVNVELGDRKKMSVDLGYVPLSSDVKLLKEAEVTANAAKVQMSGDSIVFNVEAFRVPEGSTLEALVKLLPGAKVDDSGNITINGKTVNKILIDGKEFFLNDPNMAMKNLPTNMVQKIKSYERKSDMARVTGIDDGEEETVLDLTVKKGMMDGMMGNFTGGIGTENRYQGRGFLSRFTDDSHAVLMGNAGNVNDRWGWRRPTGKTSRKEVGGSYAKTTETLESGGSMQYRYNGADQWSNSNSENYVAERGAFNKNLSKNLSGNHSANGNLRFEWKPDTMTNIIFRPSMNFSVNRGSSFRNSGSYDIDPDGIDFDLAEYLDKVVNTSISRSQSYSKNVGFNGEFQFNRRLSNNGRNITLRITGAYNDGKNKNLSAADIQYKSLGTSKINNRYYETPSTNYNVMGNLTYSEPIADRTYLQLSYQYKYSYNKNDREAFIYDNDVYKQLDEKLQFYRYDINGIVQALKEAGINPLDKEHNEEANKLSQFSEYTNYDQTISLQLRRVRDAYNFNVGVDAFPQHSKLNYRYMGNEYPEVTRSVFNWAPRVQLQWKFDKTTNLRLRYNGRTSQPSMTNLLEITDDSDPMNIRTGNSKLKPSFSQNFNANFNTSNAETLFSLWSYMFGSTTSNSIEQKTVYDKETGVQTTKPVNVNGNWNVRGGVGTSVGLGEQKLFTVGGGLGGSFNNNVGFYNNASKGVDPEEMAKGIGMKSVTKRYGLNGDVNSSFRNDWVNIELRGELNYANSKNNVNTKGNEDTWDYKYGTELQWTLPWGTEIATDIYMTSRRGYNVKDMNTDELLWNASVSHTFFGALTLKAEVFDILGQQTNITRTVNAFMRSDSRNNGIYQYGMLSLTYRFNLFGGKDGRSGGGPGGFPGPGPGPGPGGRGGFPGGGFPGGGFPGGGRPR